jgi:hypothetical protein
MLWPQKASLNAYLFVYHATFQKTELNLLERMAGTTRLELATSAVTGQRSNQLNYVPAIVHLLVGGHGFEPRTFPV